MRVGGGTGFVYLSAFVYISIYASIFLKFINQTFFSVIEFNQKTKETPDKSKSTK
jgi:hypothetical protein